MPSVVVRYVHERGGKGSDGRATWHSFASYAALRIIGRRPDLPGSLSHDREATWRRRDSRLVSHVVFNRAIWDRVLPFSRAGAALWFVAHTVDFAGDAGSGDRTANAATWRAEVGREYVADQPLPMVAPQKRIHVTNAVTSQRPLPSRDHRKRMLNTRHTDCLSSILSLRCVSASSVTFRPTRSEPCSS